MIKWVLVYIMMQGTQPVAVNAHGPNEYFDEKKYIGFSCSQ